MFNKRKRTKLSFSGPYMKCSDVFWQMAALKTRVVNLIARNLREPKGLGGHFIRVSFSHKFLIIKIFTENCTGG